MYNENEKKARNFENIIYEYKKERDDLKTELKNLKEFYATDKVGNECLIEALEKRVAELTEEKERMYKLCYEEAGLTPDCNPYYCIQKLKARHEKAVELPEKLISLKKAVNLVDRKAFAILDNLTVEKVYVSSVEFQEDNLWLNVSKSERVGTTDWSSSVDDIFLTKAEAEKALREKRK